MRWLIARLALLNDGREGYCLRIREVYTLRAIPVGTDRLVEGETGVFKGVLARREIPNSGKEVNEAAMLDRLLHESPGNKL